MRRNAEKRVAEPERTAGRRYTTHNVGQAIRKAIDAENARRQAACDAAGDGPPALLPRWAPNQLRHLRGTEVRKAFGLEGAQVLLGHERADVTQVYAERDADLARRIAEQSG